MDGEDNFLTVFVHVHNKVFPVSAGDGSQRVKWLGHVAIARWDEDYNQGWRRLGIPTAIEMMDFHATTVTAHSVVRRDYGDRRAQAVAAGFFWHLIGCIDVTCIARHAVSYPMSSR